MADSSDTLDMKEFQLHSKDTGSADVQIALLTRRIAQLTPRGVATDTTRSCGFLLL